MSAESCLPCGLSVESLTGVLRSAISNQSADVGKCHVTSLTSGTSRASVWRMIVDTRLGPHQSDVSLVYKTIENVTKSGTHLSAPDPRWKREALLVESGLLGQSQLGVQAPTCYQIDHISPTKLGLWFQDVGDRWSEGWSHERYALAARHLGQFNSGYLVQHAVPNDAFLCRHLWLETLEACSASIDFLKSHREHPAALQVYNRETCYKLLSLWRRRRQLVEQAYAVSPTTLCHGDTGGRNLYELPSQPNQTVAIDWHYVGLEPLGLDAARLLGSSLHWFFRGRMDEAASLSEAICEGYMDGLRDVGWQGDQASVRDVYHTAAATIYGLSYTHILQQLLGGAVEEYGRRIYGCSGEEVIQHRRDMGVFFCGLIEKE